MEQIGGVIIQDNHYTGNDAYSDGAVEDTLLSLVMENPGVKYNDLPGDKRDWPSLYHLSPLRENIISWIPVTAMDKVLEVGSGCGAITGVLSEKAGSVTCVELSHKRSLINAYRHQDKDNITIHLGNYQDIEPDLEEDYDYIFLVGVLEYAGSYLDSPNPYNAMVASLKRHLSPMGRLVIAIENRLGLKYFAGNREDHTGEYFSGIENYPDRKPAVTFSRRRLEDICKSAGFKYTAFYYPYPDYKFMTCLYSDERLPKEGELSDNMRNFDHDRMYLFDEKAAFDAIVTDGLFPIFSNSFLVVAGPSLPVVYARYSNDRAPKFAIRTEIRHPSDGVRGSALAALLRDKGTKPEESYDKNRLEVRKIPLSREASPHVTAMEQTYNKLIQTYPGSGLIITPVTIDGDQAVFPFLEGRTLEEVLDRCLDTDNEESFRQFFDYYYKLISAGEKGEIANYDFIFSNIIITTDNRWHLIDYEWQPPKKATLDELAARALFCYGLGSDKRKAMAHRLLAEKFGCSSEEIEKLAGREERFQRFTTGGEGSLVDVRNMLDMPIIPVMDQIRKYLEANAYNRIQIYEDYGQGYSEEHSYFLQDSYPEKQSVTVDIDLRWGIRGLRIDPALDYCLLYINEVAIGNNTYALNELEKKLDTNGVLLGNGLILFSTEDPYFSIKDLDLLMEESSGELGSVEDSMQLSLEMEMVRISDGMGRAAASIGVEEDGDQGPGVLNGIKTYIKGIVKR